MKPPHYWPEALKARFQAADDIIETSCAYILLTGGEALKVKKAVDFGFLDFSTPEKRLKALNAELRLNRETAPDIYQYVIDIDAEPGLLMRRFDTKAVLAEQATDRQWHPEMKLMSELAHNLARFHAGASLCTSIEHKSNLDYVIDSNRSNMALFADQSPDVGLSAETLKTYDVRLGAIMASAQAGLERRYDQGFVRRCHGDLHLGNILIENHKPILFDCIEFNERLMWIDTLYDLAFLLMDLRFRGQGRAANHVLNGYLEAMAALEPGREAGLMAGLQYLSLFMSVRAGVRCHVESAQITMSEPKFWQKPRDYLTLAQALVQAAPPQIILIGGLSGAGKSTQARHLAPQMGGAAGAVILRSDAIRKRILGYGEYDRLPAEAYSPNVDLKVSDHILMLSEVLMKAGQVVIVDATFRNPVLQTRIRNLAREMDIPLKAYWLNVPQTERARRVALRHDDVSDADVKIVLSQVGGPVPDGFEPYPFSGFTEPLDL